MVLVVTDFEYRFPAIRGVQAGREYYVSQCPLRLIPRLFQFDDPDLPAEVRAQRAVNRGRLPEIANYLLTNRDDYVFSALTASIDADVQFDPLGDAGDASRVGVLRVPMSAKFIVNDGQHRRGGIELALHQEPTLGDETIAVVFFIDRGLDRCQQMFADLNRYAIRPSASISVLYDHRDPYATVAKEVVGRSPLLRDVVERERTTLSLRSKKLFTLSAVFNACRSLLSGLGLDEREQIETAGLFWSGVAFGFPEWEEVREGRLSAGELRQDYIHSHGTVLHSLGRVGNVLLRDRGPQIDWKRIGKKLGQIDWSKRNIQAWEGRALTGGRVSKAATNVTLTTNYLKIHLGLPLTPEEQRVEDAFTGGRDA